LFFAFVKQSKIYSIKFTRVAPSNFVRDPCFVHEVFMR
jgi:hypothetical protein